MNIEIKSTIKSAWALVAGSKRAFFSTFFAFILLQVLLLTIKTEFDRFVPYPTVSNLLIFVLTVFLVSPLVTGFMIMGLKRAKDQTILWKNGFAYYNQIGRLFLTYISAAFLAYAALLIFAVVFFGSMAALFYLIHPVLIVRYVLLAIIVVLMLILVLSLTTLFSFSLILTAERKSSPLKAPFHSAKMIWPHLKKMVLLFVSLLCINIIGALLLGVGLIWTLPLLYISIGKVYLQLS